MPATGDLPLAARRAFVVPELVHSLISVPTLCDHGCTATFTAFAVDVSFNGRRIYTGSRVGSSTNALDQLWHIDLDCPLGPMTGAAHQLVHHDTNAELVAFYHAAMGSPALPTFLEAVAQKFLVLPGLTAALIRKNPPSLFATAKGHLNRTRRNLRSTKLQGSSVPSPALEPLGVTGETFTAMNTLFLTTVETRVATHTGHSDTAGRFPYTSVQGSQYILLFVNEDANYIHLEPMPSRSNKSFIDAYRRGMNFFWRAGFKPNIERMDNEISTEVLALLRKTFDITPELVPPHNHRTLRAERALQTFKNHFISTLASCDPNMPLELWEHLLPQVETTLNLMRASAMNPTISAYEHLRGPYDANRYPMIPLGMRVLVYEQAKTQRASWAAHGVPGYYLGPSPLHYRTFRTWVVATRSERITDTLSWHPVAVHMPGSNPSEVVAAAITDLITALRLPASMPAVTLLIPSLTAKLQELRSLYQSASTNLDPTPMEEFQRVQVEAERVPVPQALIPLPPTLTSPPDPPLASDVMHPEVAVIAPLLVQPPVQIPSLAASTPTPATSHSPLFPWPLLPVPVAPLASVPPLERTRVRTFRQKRPPPRYANMCRQERHSTRFANMCCALVANQSIPSKDGVATAQALEPFALKDAPPPPLVVPALNLRDLLQGPESEIWEEMEAEEFDRLLETTSCMRFCKDSDKPKSQKAKYFKAVCTAKLNGEIIIRRVRITVADTHSEYAGPTSAYTASLTTLNLLLNSVVSDDAGWMTADIKDYYLGTPMKYKEYMYIPVKYIPRRILIKYGLQDRAPSSSVMVEISKGMYGLAQAGRLAQDRLFKLLAANGYHQAPHTPCLFRHASLGVTFVLVVDDFGIKYTSASAAAHLLGVLRQLYTITVDDTGSQYVGLSIEYTRTEPRHITISMPGTIQAALKRYQFTPRGRPTNHPMVHTPFQFGQRSHEALPEDDSPPLPPLRVTRLQSIIGTFQHVARALDVTLVCPISKLATSPKTMKTEQMVEHFMNYLHTWSEPCVTFYASDMQLHVHSDASYLSETRARSRVAGFHCMGNYDPASGLPPNGFVSTFSSIADNVCGSAQEAEGIGIFLNAQLAIPSRDALLFMGHPQGETLIVSDNLIGVNILNGHLPPKRSRCMDMRFYWIKDRISQRQFRLEWQPGRTNLADYLTKIHPPAHYPRIRSTYVGDLPK